MSVSRRSKVVCLISSKALAPSPKDLDELAAFWSGGSVGRIVRFRLVGPGMSCFREPVRVRWLAGRMVEAGP